MRTQRIPCCLKSDQYELRWGGTPTIAIFATNHRSVEIVSINLMCPLMLYSYKRESYRGSEFAGRVLADAGIPVVMKVSQYVSLAIFRF